MAPTGAIRISITCEYSRNITPIYQTRRIAQIVAVRRCGEADGSDRRRPVFSLQQLYAGVGPSAIGCIGLGVQATLGRRGTARVCGHLPSFQTEGSLEMGVVSGILNLMPRVYSTLGTLLHANYQTNCHR